MDLHVGAEDTGEAEGPGHGSEYVTAAPVSERRCHWRNRSHRATGYRRFPTCLSTPHRTVPLEFPPSPSGPEAAIAANHWSAKDSEKLYNMPGLGARLLPGQRRRARVTVHPDGNPKRGLDLFQLAIDLNAQGVGLPLLLRFSDILRARIETLGDPVPERHHRVRLRRRATPPSIRSRSTSSATWCRRSWSSARPTAWGSSAAPSPSCRRCWASPRAPSR